MAIRAVHHVAISTPDLERLRAFYCDVIGFEDVSRTAWPQGQDKIDRVMALKGTAAAQAMLRLGGLCLELFQFESPTPASPALDRPVNDHGITHLCFDVEDVELAYQRLLAAGTRFHCPPQDFGEVRATYGRDPDGNVFEIQQIVA